MSTAELLDEIEEARASARELADVTDAEVKAAAKVFEDLARDLDVSENRLREAVRILRRAGLL